MSASHTPAETWQAGVNFAIALCRRHTNSTSMELAALLADAIEDRDISSPMRWRSTRLWTDATQWRYPLDRPVGDKKELTVTVSTGGNNIVARNVTGSPRRFDTVREAMMWLRPKSKVPAIVIRHERLPA